MRKITFYTNPMSRGRIVRWMLEECEAQYDTHCLDYDAIKKPDYLDINPMGKLPALKHGDTVVTETVAILTYLADIFPEKQLAPATDSPLRGEYYRWLFFISNALEAAMVNESLGFAPTEPSAVRRLGYGCKEDVLTALRKELEGRDYLVGDQFSTVDLLLASVLAFYIFQLKVMEPEPLFTQFIERMTARLAAVKGGKLDAQLMEEMQS